MSQRYFLVSAMLGIVFFGMGCGAVQKQTDDVEGDMSIAPTPVVDPVEPYIISDEFTYPFALFVDGEHTDLVDANNTSTVFFADLISYMRQTQVIPESFDTTNAGDQTVRQVSIISVFDNKTKVVLQGDPMLDGFGVLRPLWVFDTKTNTFLYLKTINNMGPMGYIHETMVSPNGTKMALVLDSNLAVCDIVRVFDFSTDTVTDVEVSLSSKDESLCMYDAGFVYRTGNIEWVSDTQMKYSVFGYIDPAMQLKTGQAAPLVETRVFTLR